MNDEPEQEALFQIEGPDKDGCVWICSAQGRDVWCQVTYPASERAEASDWNFAPRLMVNKTLK